MIWKIIQIAVSFILVIGVCVSLFVLGLKMIFGKKRDDQNERE